LEFFPLNCFIDTSSLDTARVLPWSTTIALNAWIVVLPD
jgi:hypothetical protein